MSIPNQDLDIDQADQKLWQLMEQELPPSPPPPCPALPPSLEQDFEISDDTTSEELPDALEDIRTNIKLLHQASVSLTKRDRTEPHTCNYNM